jgi:hypothetical protein
MFILTSPITPQLIFNKESNEDGKEGGADHKRKQEAYLLITPPIP